jgi:hypothetical protein
MMGKSLTFIAMAIALGGIAAAQNKPDATKAPQDATQKLAHDNHDGLTILADPYVDKARGKEKFGKANPLDVGILPVEVFLRNETSQPIHVDINTIQLEVHLRKGGRQEIDWLPVEDVASLIAHPEGIAPSKKPRVAGIQLPSNDKKAQKFAEVLRPLTLDADVVPPLGALHGFLYFDVNNEMSLADTAILYIPDVTVVATKKTLMFYEVRLGKPAQPAASPSQ